MIKGLYASFTALEAAWKYQDMLANNIANSNTAGFKREIAAQQSFADILLAQQAPVPAPLSARIQAVVGQIGTGTFVAEFATDFSDGVMQPTGNELDLALQGGFFAVQTPDGQVYYTRDGRFGRDASGDLVTSHGYYVLSRGGSPMRLPAEPVAVGSDGTIERNGEVIDQLAIVDFTPAQLTRAGEAYFTSVDPGVPVNGGVRQGYLENSNTAMVEELTSLMAVNRVFQANQTLLSVLDGTLNTATTEIGSVGGTA